MDIFSRAKSINANICLPEAHWDSRVAKACEILTHDDLCHITVFGEAKDWPQNDNITVIDIENYEKYDELVDIFFNLRKYKIASKETARLLLKQPVIFATMLLYIGVVDGVVCGATMSTADSLRPALQIIKARQNTKVCATMLMRKDKDYLFSDPAINIDLTAEELADVAIANADFMTNVLGQTPAVAMLSYSTLGSGKGGQAQKIRLATDIVREKRPSLNVVGEVQVDAILDKSVGQRKGLADFEPNILIFPNLECGNIGYKLVQYLAGYEAIGPICLNFRKPVNDLSRGCSVEDIVNTVLITKLQTKGEKL